MWFPREKALWPIALVSRGVTSAKTHYSNIERETVDILHGLENSTITASPMKLV